MIIWIICAAEGLVLMAICLFKIILKRREHRRELWAVQKIMRRNKLDDNLKNHRTQDENFQLNKLYLCITFLGTSPKIIWAFGLEIPLTIGRGKTNVIQLRSQRISRDHCCIFESGGFLYLYNEAARNPLYIKRGILRRRIGLDPGQSLLLQNRDVIVAAQFRLKLRLLRGREAFTM